MWLVLKFYCMLTTQKLQQNIANFRTSRIALGQGVVLQSNKMLLQLHHLRVTYNLY